MNILRRTYDWMGTKVHSPYGIWWLAGLFFIESSVFPIPVDPLLILFCVENNKRSFYYATVCTVASVVGGAFGYFIGAVLWKSIGLVLVSWLISEQTFYGLVAKYKIYQNWAVFIAGFTPVPYKAVTISAGFCHLSFVPFIFYSILGRGGRFYLVALLIYFLGERVKIFIDKYFNQLAVLFVVIVIISFTVLK
jgi:membrane protein YqaA with SNARE-associated domain